MHTISQRVAGFLERAGILECDEENSYLNLEGGEEDSMQQEVGCSVSYRIAIGPQQGRKVFTLQTIPAWEEDDRFAQLAALVPKPRVNLTRFHGVFAPNSKHRVDVTPAKRGKGSKHHESDDKTPEQQHKAMTWAQRLKRVFNIDVSTCPKCGGESKVIACIEDQAVIDKILQHLQAKGILAQPPELLPAARASPDSLWFA